MSTDFKEIYRQSLQLSPDERKRLADYLLNPPPPPSTEDVLAALEPHVEELRALGVTRLGIFGSTVRGESDPASDIDILAKLAEPSFRGFMRVKFALEEILGRTVDLVLEDGLRKELRPAILKDVRYVPGL